MEGLRNGCRAEYGPLGLRIETTASANGFTVFVDDPRRQPACVYEQTVQAGLESVKEFVVLRAQDYLDSFREAAPQGARWRCS
jgi:hypothetical protein